MEDKKETILDEVTRLQEEYNQLLVKLLEFIDKQQDLDPEYNEIVNKHFNELLW